MEFLYSSRAGFSFTLRYHFHFNKEASFADLICMGRFILYAEDTGNLGLRVTGFAPERASVSKNAFYAAMSCLSGSKYIWAEMGSHLQQEPMSRSLPVHLVQRPQQIL